MVWGKIGSRPMVSGGNVLAYKPKGTSSYIFGSKNNLHISNISVVPHSASNRQSDSCFIYKSSGGNTLKTSLPIKSGSVELVPIIKDRSISLQGIFQVSSRNILFISYIEPHKAVKTSSISRWLKDVLRLSGIDTSHFSAHSTRSASSTFAVNCGVSISDIMKVTDWSGAGTFKKFYQRPNLDRILSSASSVGNPRSYDGENEVDRG